jgi:hypothetical protein
MQRSQREATVVKREHTPEEILQIYDKVTDELAWQFARYACDNHWPPEKIAAELNERGYDYRPPNAKLN